MLPYSYLSLFGLLWLTGCATQPAAPATSATTVKSAAKASEASSCQYCLFGYPSIPQAIRALSALPGTETRTESGWVTLMVRSRDEIWSLTEPSHAAYPSIVKRKITRRNFRRFQRIAMDTQISCLAANRQYCQQLQLQIKQSNQELQQQLNQK